MHHLKLAQTNKPTQLDLQARFSRELFKARCRKIPTAQTQVDLYSQEFRQFIHEYPSACILERTGPGETRVHQIGTQLTSSFNSEENDQWISRLFRKTAGVTVLELLEVAFIFPANLSIPLVSIGNPWKRPLNGEITVVPMDQNSVYDRFAFTLISLDSGKSVKGLTFDLKKSGSFEIDRIPSVSTALNMPKFSKPRLVFSIV